MTYHVEPAVSDDYGPGWGVFTGSRWVGGVWFAERSFAESFADICRGGSR